MFWSSLFIFLFLFAQPTWAQESCDQGSEVVRRCCELENEIRLLHADLHSLREGDPQSPEFITLKKEYDRLMGEKILLQGIKQLAQDFNQLRDNLIEIDQEGSPLNHMTRAIVEEAETLKKIQAVHHAFEELNLNEDLRSATNADELQVALRERCSATTLSESAMTLCEGLNLRSGATVEGFENAEQFLGSFLEAYVFAAQASTTDEQRRAQISQYQELLSAEASAPLIDTLLSSSSEHSSEIDRALSVFSPEQLNQHTRLGRRALTECLETLRYSQQSRVDSTACQPELVRLEEVIEERRQSMLGAINADTIVRNLIHQTMNESPNLSAARSNARARLQVITNQLALGSDSQQELGLMINQFQQNLRAHSQTSLSEIPSDRFMNEFFQEQRSDDDQAANRNRLRTQSQEILNQMGCQTPETQFFIADEQNQLSINSEKLHQCFLVSGADTDSMQERVSAIDDEQTQLQERMQSITRRPDFVQGQALLNFLAHRSATECPGRTESEMVQTCFHQDHGGQVQLMNLLSQGEVITSYYIDAHRPNDQTAIEATRMQEFCLQNRARYPIGCPEATQIYRDITEGGREQRINDYREYFRTTAVSTDPRTGAVTRTPRRSTGAMVATGLATSLVGNLGWGLNYWQTNQMLPGMQAQAFQMKNAQAWQNQQWLYFQQAYYNPGFGGFGGMGAMPSTHRSPISTGVQSITF
jgi:hypothetical protein